MIAAVRERLQTAFSSSLRVMVAAYEQLLLFGDSITQAGAVEDGFGLTAPLQHAYQRRLDVVNRGFNGYNTERALQVLPRLVPAASEAKVRLMTVFFGANDASLPESTNKQHVPLDQYTENLRTICTHEAVKAQNPSMIIITPPPVNEYKMEMNDLAKGYRALQRTAEHTQAYANAARKVGEHLGIPVLDLWTIFMTRIGWVAGEPLPGSKSTERHAVLEELMYDGLHLSPKAYEIVVEELMGLIARAYPEQVPVKLPYVYPDWKDTERWARF
ncbi:uncharacterized protein K452DRAFT_296434 [Aplosporella prunicola CBS 121167]|uniref:SGNH hydrolase-type esterase domain-containing protein n=1 Tax=Aplosporella prunicola CBS 121167 TaxID=1176127 RepID=A0A6A6BLE1_9PEZI|nr:uncharacterized protein K452DRAFT_296434 [Aplosporella prunicola CBS 121167]KAF2144213.1 hypothetical protein K452DRAFT_296434 [Aplosporella prunicola CBS 121167]